VICGFSYAVDKTLKTYTCADGSDLTKRWIKDLKELDMKIKVKYKEVEKHLTAVGKSNGNFQSEDWGMYKMIFLQISADLNEFAIIIEHLQLELMKFTASCGSFQSYFKAAEVMLFFGVGGLIAACIWERGYSGMKKLHMGAIASGCLVGYATLRYHSPARELAKLEKDLCYYKCRLEIIQCKQGDLSEWNARRSLDEFVVSLQHVQVVE
jgi:hypothetical protein